MYVFNETELRAALSRKRLTCKALARETRLDIKTIARAVTGRPISTGTLAAIQAVIGRISFVEVEAKRRGKHSAEWRI